MAITKSRKQAPSSGKSYTEKEFNEQELIRAGVESPELFQLWIYTLKFADTISILSKREALNFWQKYWKTAVAVLGRINVADPKHRFWFPRLKGLLLFALEELIDSLDKPDLVEFSNRGSTRFELLGETTIEIGSAFGTDRIIYAGKAVTIYKGVDDIVGKGELMIAVKHEASGCWSHRPSPKNAPVPLSDYKKSKSALREYPAALKGELTHSQSRKLAELLGLTVRENYAYLLK
ncbi:hypothetical protein QUA43_30395 [Microcoleus sp. N9_B4]|uniref:hypothetical protein n=1 Tax=Microcoleus sp. N9_B4 TaxID=3055386 RepID=UPI002FD6DB3D